MSNINLPRQYIAPQIALLLLSFYTMTATSAEPVLPGAGSILQELAPSITPMSMPAKQGVEVTIDRTKSITLPLSSPFLVKSFQVTGNRLIDTPTLLALLESAKGKTLTLLDLSEVAARITTYYRSHDYPLARAIIPGQTIVQGVVRIDVIEAVYGQIKLDNSSKVKDALLQSTLLQLQSGEPISQVNMDHVLLLLSDVPGVLVDATLKPGDAIGSSDFVVTTSQGPSAYGSLMLDDYGNSYTGRDRLGGSLSVLNLLHHGDTLSVNALSSGRGMNYGRIGYDFLLNGIGTHVGGAYSSLNYVLGAPITTDIHGTAEVGSLWVNQPFIRSRYADLNGQIQYDDLVLRDFYSSTIQIDRGITKLTTSLTGDSRDQWLAGGINSWNLGWSLGRVRFDNSAAQVADASTANSQGSFSKLNANIVRLQSLTLDDSLYLTASAQWASKNLDTSQKMSVGGPYTVRAYDMGALSGDSGYFLSAEYRHNLSWITAGKLQLVAFVDSANVTFNSNIWTGVTGANSGTLSGVGAGANWIGPDQWGLKAYIATPIGSAPALVAVQNSARLWVELGRRF